MTWPAAIENMVLYGLIGFLCWHFDSGWPVLLVLVANTAGVIRKKIADACEEQNRPRSS